MLSAKCVWWLNWFEWMTTNYIWQPGNQGNWILKMDNYWLINTANHETQCRWFDPWIQHPTWNLAVARFHKQIAVFMSKRHSWITSARPFSTTLFVLQDEAQLFSWNNAQAILHPFVCYYCEAGNDCVSHVSYVVISDCNIYDTIIVHLFQKNLISSSLNLHQPIFLQSNSTFRPQKSTTKKQLFLQAICRAKTIAGTQKLHFFKQLSLNDLEVAIYFTCSIRRKEIVTDGLSLVDIKEYLMAIYDGNWWVAYVMDVIPANKEAELNFLHPYGPSPSYCYPRHSDTLHVHVGDIPTYIHPTTDTGWIYKLSRGHKQSIRGPAKNLNTC